MFSFIANLNTQIKHTKQQFSCFEYKFTYKYH